jgi:hypothetical protein
LQLLIVIEMVASSSSSLNAQVIEKEPKKTLPDDADHVLRGVFSFVHPCIQLQIGVKLLGCREYSNQEMLRAEANDKERPFICPIQPKLGVGG